MPTSKRRRRGGRRVPVDRRRLPAGPLLEAVDAYAARRQQPVEELLDDALQDRLRDATRSGTVTVGSASRCCDALGWHPRMLWGQVYDRTITDDPPHRHRGAWDRDRVAAGVPLSGLPRRQPRRDRPRQGRPRRRPPHHPPQQPA